MLHPRQEDKGITSIGSVGIATTIFVFTYLEFNKENSTPRMLHFCTPKLKQYERQMTSQHTVVLSLRNKLSTREIKLDYQINPWCMGDHKQISDCSLNIDTEFFIVLWD